MNRIKRLFSAFLLFLVVFNTIGYYGLFYLVQQQLTAPILQKIDANSNQLGGDLVFTVPLEAPYSQTDEYVRIDGEIVFDNVVYRLVKQKIYKNMLYIVCVKDNLSTYVRAEMSDYSKVFSGQQAEHTNSNIKIINSLSKDYSFFELESFLKNSGWLRETNFQIFKSLYFFEINDSLLHPPRA